MILLKNSPSCRAIWLHARQQENTVWFYVHCYATKFSQIDQKCLPYQALQEKTGKCHGRGCKIHGIATIVTEWMRKIDMSFFSWTFFSVILLEASPPFGFLDCSYAGHQTESFIPTFPFWTTTPVTMKCCWDSGVLNPSLGTWEHSQDQWLLVKTQRRPCSAKVANGPMI